MPSGPSPGRISGRSENNSYTYISWEEVTITNFKNPLNSNEYIDFTLYGREGCLLMLNQLLVVLVECSVQAYDHVARFSCSCFKHLLASQVLYTKNLFLLNIYLLTFLHFNSNISDKYQAIYVKYSYCFCFMIPHLRAGQYVPKFRHIDPCVECFEFRVSDPDPPGSACFCPVRIRIRITLRIRIRAKKERKRMNKS